MPMSGTDALFRWLAQRGVATVFGTFDPGLPDTLRLQRARTGRGAALMSEGAARASGAPAVALVRADGESFDALAVLAQARTDSVPLLLLSLQTDTGLLDLTPLSRPLTAVSRRVERLADLPAALNDAWRAFGEGRARPTHLVLPRAVLEACHDAHSDDPNPATATDSATAGAIAATTAATAEPTASATGRTPSDRDIEAAAQLLRTTPLRPVMIIGRGALGAGQDLVAIAEMTGALVVSSVAGKGIVPDDHPQSLGAAVGRDELQNRIDKADVLLVVGSALDPVDTGRNSIAFSGDFIRIDHDPALMRSGGHPDIELVGDATATIARLRKAIGTGGIADRQWVFYISKVIRDDIDSRLTPIERQHAHLINLIQHHAPEGTVWSTDACELAANAALTLPTRSPGHFLHPNGLGVTGTAIPAAMGVRGAFPEASVAVLTDNDGLFAAVQELPVAGAQGHALPIIVWENDAAYDIDLVAEACGCAVERPASSFALEGTVADAFKADRPWLILLGGDTPWLG
ncbi:MAG: hypothetical protein CSB44_11885 [Gammaproteobacteria bacterium]|nr:MAG: hypothetical protein CSB44_11885 [Gammaproteobacteria bacterium]